MDITVDREDLRSFLLEAFAREPELFAEVVSLFWCEKAPYKASAAFDYLFIVSTSPTVGAVDPIVGFRLRSTEDRIAALRALDRKKTEFLDV
jgi:hypothetical protein